MELMEPNAEALHVVQQALNAVAVVLVHCSLALNVVAVVLVHCSLALNVVA